MSDMDKLSASNIRFLLTMKYLLDCNETPGCARLAKVLKCAKPSVNKMMKYLDGKELIQYENRLAPVFTPEGEELALKYGAYYERVCSLLGIETDGIDEAGAAVCAFLAEAPDEVLMGLKDGADI